MAYKWCPAEYGRELSEQNTWHAISCSVLPIQGVALKESRSDFFGFLFEFFLRLR